MTHFNCPTVGLLFNLYLIVEVFGLIDYSLWIRIGIFKSEFETAFIEPRDLGLLSLYMNT